MNVVAPRMALKSQDGPSTASWVEPCSACYPPVFAVSFVATHSAFRTECSDLCNTFFCSLYLGFTAVFCMATIIISFSFPEAKFQGFCASLFINMGFSVIATILHKLILFQGQAEALQTSGYEFRYQLNHSMGLGPWFIRQWFHRDGSPANLPSVDNGHSRYLEVFNQ